ncbi:MAG: hypothetical protein J0M08_08005 [Bacteroidetes bacterium]|nr:hypothetical protein [Bacteroidota bacterium]
MKKILPLLFIVFFTANSFAQDNAIQVGEKVAVTFFDFDFALGFWGEKSRTVKIGSEEKKTVEVIMRNMEESFNKRYNVTLEPAKLNYSGDEGVWTVKCFPKIKTKNAIELGYDKIIEINAYMHASAAIGIGVGPVSVSEPKPVMFLKVKIKDKTGKTIWSKTARIKDDERQTSIAVGGFNANGGFTGESIIDLYNATLEKVFLKVDKKK